MTGPISPELQNKIAQWRQKAAAGTLTIEETREAIIALRSGRQGASYDAKSPKRSAKSADDMLGELGL